MNRRDRNRRPRAGMVWSEKHRMWTDPDTRGPERRAKDEVIVRSVEGDQERLREALRRAESTRSRQADALDRAAESLALAVLRELVEARVKAGLTQTEVARRMSISPSAVVRLESGAHSPTLSTLSRFAAAVGVTLEVRRIA